MPLSKPEYQRLHRLLAQPAAPFREALVVREVRRLLDEAAVPHFADPHGNIVVGVADAAAYRTLLARRSREPVRLFIAHMDHPGFHVTRRLAPERLALRWYGGSPLKHLAGAEVWLADGEEEVARGRLAVPRLHKSGRMLERAELLLEAPLPSGVRLRRLYGGLGFGAPVRKCGQRLYARAADDLVGVFAIIETARRLFAGRRRSPPPFLGLLSRAEEVGFVGTVAHLELGWQRRAARPLLAVSLEASRTLVGAELGKGPVVRLGDRRTVFDAGGLQVLTELAGRLLPGAHQRRLMDGGACEATAATAWGLPTVAMSVPLGNYHNQGFEGAPGYPANGGPAPEFVHLDDVAGLLSLCRGLLERGLPWTDAWAGQRQRLTENRDRYTRQLTER